MTVKTNDVVRVKPYQNDFEVGDRNTSGRLGRIICIDHPATTQQGNLTVVLFPVHNSLGEKVHSSLRFYWEYELELV